MAHHIILGPVIVYMAKVDNALTASGTSANWFKVAQAGLLSTDYWVRLEKHAICKVTDPRYREPTL
jgi:hypothetical protein